jgi:hypothetical protein
MTLSTKNRSVKIRRTLIVSLMMLMSTISSSALLAQQSLGPQWCTWKVSAVWTSADSTLFALFKERGDHIALCNIRGDWKGLPKESCKAWNQYLSVALLTNKSVIVHYTSAPPCETIPHYSNAPAATYVMLYDPK